MRVPRLGLAIVCFGCAGLLSGEALQITTTPSHTSTQTPTPTPTITPTPTGVPTRLPTPWVAGSNEFRINASTATAAWGVEAAPAADDGFVVAWSQGSPGESGYDILMRRFDAAGNPLSGDVQVNESTTGNPVYPSVASDGAGNFVVVWNGQLLPAVPTVFMRRFDANGQALSPETPVNPGGLPAFTGHVAMSDGGFVIVWASGSNNGDGDDAGVFARRYDAAGVLQGDTFPVNTYTTGVQNNPSLAMSSSGNFVVAWESRGQDGDLTGIFAQRFGSDGTPSGSEFQVNARTAGEQVRPDVAAGEGDYVIVWTGSTDGDDYGVFARTLAYGGAGLGPELQVNTYTTSLQGQPKVARDRANFLEGGFVVAWQSFGPDDPTSDFSGVLAQRFANAPFGTAAFSLVAPPRRGSEYVVNTYTTGAQGSPDVAIGKDGRFLIAWISIPAPGSPIDITGRVFQPVAANHLAVDKRPTGGLATLNGVLEPGETVTVDPSWSRFEPTGPQSDLPLSATASNLIGPPGPTYTIPDGAAGYGAIPATETRDCFTATGDCYEVSVGSARPAMHWDATFDEELSAPGSIIAGTKKTWALHVGESFADVPHDGFYSFIENVFHNGITAGGGCGAGQYCGEDNVLRQQMAVFLVKAIRGPGYVPPPAGGGMFDDVPQQSPFAPWIEELARTGVTAGCTAPPPPALPSYCPTAAVNRQQMAVFLMKAYFGADTGAPICTAVFDDVPCSSPFAPWIEFLVNMQVTAGCSVSPPLYCPADLTKRKQMAVFLVKTFGLQLYGAD